VSFQGHLNLLLRLLLFATLPGAQKMRLGPNRFPRACVRSRQPSVFAIPALTLETHFLSPRPPDRDTRTQICLLSRGSEHNGI